MLSVEKYLPLVSKVVIVTNKDAVEDVKTYLKEELPGEDIPVISGGSERFESSYLGLRFLKETDPVDIVLIHDAARAFITEDIIGRALEEAESSGTAVAAVPSKDTIKIADRSGNVLDTPDRELLYAVQTPQAFSFDLILEAYDLFMAERRAGSKAVVTDDASVVEQFTDHKVKLIEGSYDNIKITTPEDLKMLSLS